MKKSEIQYTQKLPKLDYRSSLLIYDKVLENKYKNWIKKFPHRYGVKSGENLKDLSQINNHLSIVFKKMPVLARSKINLVSFGGGSVGDFSGFLASIYKRGINFIQIPSTWLAAIDSAHGGKTAMNFKSYKNQIGTFYPAQIIFICKDVLLKLPQQRVLEAEGEVLKMALLTGGSLWKKYPVVMTAKQLWTFLPLLIEAKWKFILKDPYEAKGIRHLLNLGHTMGHVIESQLRIAHGISVLHGIRFAIEFSLSKGFLKEPINRGLLSHEKTIQVLRKLRKIDSFLIQDKKISSNKKIRFIFLKKPGQAVLKEVTIKEIETQCHNMTKK